MTEFFGFDGNDSFFGGAADDDAEGVGGADTFYGRGGDDSLGGGTGPDSLFGGGNDDTLNADFAGDGDRLFGGAGTDKAVMNLFGGTGELVFSLAGGGATSAATLAGSTGAVLVGIEEVDIGGGNLSDTLSGSSGSDTLRGGSGDDTLFGGSGDDVLSGSAITGQDKIYGGSGTDTAVFSAIRGNGSVVFDFATAGPVILQQAGQNGQTLYSMEAVSFNGVDDNDTLGGGVADDFLSGGTGLDTIYGSEGDDRLYGSAGSDSLFGGSGDDSLNVGDGGGLASGGSGVDLLRHFGSSDSDVLVNIGGESGSFLDVSFSDIEAMSLFLRGDGDVLFIGGDGGDRVVVNTGNDGLAGNGGDDVLFGGLGDDQLYGGVGDDRLDASSGLNHLFGGSGNDTLSVRPGAASTVSGGSGVDTFALVTEVAGDTLVQAKAGPTGQFVGITYSSVEALSFRLSGNANMTIRGGEGADFVRVVTGNDTLVGFSGDDTLIAEDGINKIFGGSGEDTAFLHLTESVGDVTFDHSAFDRAAIFADGNRVAGIERLNLSSGSGDDRLTGDSGADSFDGGGGDDALRGRDGDDSLYTSNRGTLFGAEGDDSLEGRLASDSLYENDGADFSIFGGDGDDDIDVLANIGSDRAMTARLEGRSGDDAISLGAANVGSAIASGGSGNDYIVVEADDLRGSFAEILGFGGAGSDTLLADEFYAESIFSVRLYGGIGNDTISGNSQSLLSGSADDITLFGGNGADLLGVGTISGNSFDVSYDIGLSFIGGAGGDVIFGQDAEGDDYARAGSGFDRIFGGSGEDTFVIGEGELLAGEQIVGGAGSDTLFLVGGNSAANLLDLSEVEVIVNMFAGGGDDHLFGNDKNDDFRGQDGNDFLYGLSGSDSLRGQSGDDSLEGGSGEDTLFGGSGTDRIEAGDGRDRLIGGDGVDLLFGDSGQDTLNGASGVDTAYGGRGNDTFIVDTLGDRVVERESGGLSDLVRSNALEITLGSGSEAFVERVIVTRAAGAARVEGSDSDNTILGNTADNLFFGREGDDILNGKGGSDTAVGGLGDDTFVVDTTSDLVREQSGRGTDLVRAETDYTLPDGTATAFVENLRLQGGFGNIDGTGNSLDNTIEGNSGANRLAGNQGADHLLGGQGGDLLFGGQGGDLMEGEGGSDTINMGADDTAFGGNGSDDFRFNGAALSTTGSGGPLIGDFDGVRLGKANGADTLLFATGLEVGSFAYVRGQAFSGGGNSEARFAGDRQVEVDRDGDGAADIFFLVEGLSQAGQLTSADFFWA